jgi:hypothetical protein
VYDMASYSDEKVRIESLILGNHVEVSNNLLYVSGGGWTDHWRPIMDGKPAGSIFGVGLVVIIPWDGSLGAAQEMRIWFESRESGEALGQPSQGYLNLSRPPWLAAGEEQRAMMAVQVPGLVFPKDGGYRVCATIGGSEAKVVNFRVHTLSVAQVVLPAAP